MVATVTREFDSEMLPLQSSMAPLIALLVMVVIKVLRDPQFQYEKTVTPIASTLLPCYFWRQLLRYISAVIQMLSSEWVAAHSLRIAFISLQSSIRLPLIMAYTVGLWLQRVVRWERAKKDTASSGCVLACMSLAAVVVVGWSLWRLVVVELRCRYGWNEKIVFVMWFEKKWNKLYRVSPLVWVLSSCLQETQTDWHRCSLEIDSCLGHDSDSDFLRGTEYLYWFLCTFALLY